jgi:hypothetical protein
MGSSRGEAGGMGPLVFDRASLVMFPRDKGTWFAQLLATAVLDLARIIPTRSPLSIIEAVRSR